MKMLSVLCGTFPHPILDPCLPRHMLPAPEAVSSEPVEQTRRPEGCALQLLRSSRLSSPAPAGPEGELAGGPQGHRSLLTESGPPHTSPVGSPVPWRVSNFIQRSGQ